VRAHVLLCMLAYHLEWHMRQALAPILFDDHHRAAAEASRTDSTQIREAPWSNLIPTRFLGHWCP